MKDIISKGILGVAAPTIGVTISMSTVELWLRIFSLLVGLLVGILSAVSIGLSIRRKWREQNGKIRKHHKKYIDEEEPTTTL